jgi:hypothetical protein
VFYCILFMIHAQQDALAHNKDMFIRLSDDSVSVALITNDGRGGNLEYTHSSCRGE